MNIGNEVWPNGILEIGPKAQRSRAVSALDIELFTKISGDRNPLHYDEELASIGGMVVQVRKVSNENIRPPQNQKVFFFRHSLKKKYSFVIYPPNGIVLTSYILLPNVK
jgi:hypothetical protein